MKADYKTQCDSLKRQFSIQFETDDKILFRIVEKACSDAVDRTMHARKREYERMKRGDTDGDRTDV